MSAFVACAVVTLIAVIAVFDFGDGIVAVAAVDTDLAVSDAVAAVAVATFETRVLFAVLASVSQSEFVN